MRRGVTAIVALSLVAGVSLASETGTLSGTFTKDGVDDGILGYLKIIGQGESCTDPGQGQGATMASFQDGKASYSLEGVANGSYTACGFIDANPQEGQVTANTGDYGTMMPVTVEGDTTLDIPDAAWMPIP